jgi:hypothetical protein
MRAARERHGLPYPRGEWGTGPAPPAPQSGGPGPAPGPG